MSTFTAHDGTELDYEDTGGEGSPLLMLHGWGQTKAMFRHQMTGLAVRHRVITLDFRGHGLSAKPHFGYRIARLARDVWELLEHLRIDRCDALGWSMGASVWWCFIDQYGTDRLLRFIAVDQPAAIAAVPWMSADEQSRSGVSFDVAALAAMSETFGGRAAATATSAFVRGMFSGDHTDPELIAFATKELDTVPSYASVPLFFDHCMQDWRDVLPRIDIETLVVGCEGSFVHPESQAYIAERIPHARLHVFPTEVASSHVPFLENPAEFNRVIEEFLGDT